MVRTSIKFEHFMSFNVVYKSIDNRKYLFIYLFVNNKIDKLLLITRTVPGDSLTIEGLILEELAC